MRRSMGNHHQKLKLFRRHRDVYSEKVAVRLTVNQWRLLWKIASDSGRTASDLVRSAVDLVIAAAAKSSEFDLYAEVERLKNED